MNANNAKGPESVDGGDGGCREQARLYWRCRRGMLELDLLLQGFVASGYEALSAGEREHFDALLALPDQQLLGLLLGGEQAGDREVADVIEKIRRAAGP